MLKRVLGLLMTFGLLLSFVAWPLARVQASSRTIVPADLMGTYPYALTYAVHVTKGNDPQMRGTATLIGNRWLLTAGHLVTNSKGKLHPKTRLDGETNWTSHLMQLKAYQENPWSSSPFKLMPGYTGYSNRTEDLALVALTEPKTIETPIVPIAIYSDLSSLVGQTVSTMGYSSYYDGDFTEASGIVLAVEENGTLTVAMPVAKENSGSPVYLNGEMIGVLTAIGPNDPGTTMGQTATVTPFTSAVKTQLFDPNGIPSVIK